jgi:hypothetical protein
MAKSVISKIVLAIVALSILGCGKSSEPAKDAAATQKEAELQKTSGEN